MDDELKGIVAVIRPLILANKGPLKIENLANDYFTTEGEPIPYKKFNYDTLEEFLKSLPTLRVCGTGRHALVEASASSASRHVTDLIAKQRSTSRRLGPATSRLYPPTLSYRGGRGGGRGGGRARAGYSRSSVSRDQSTGYHNTRDARPSREQPYGHNNAWDTGTSREQPTGHSNTRDTGTSRDHSTGYNNTRDFGTSREQHAGRNNTRDTGASRVQLEREIPKRYSPIQDTPAAPLTITVESDDRRQVSFSRDNRRNQTLPPRLQRQRQLGQINTAAPSSVSPDPQGFDSIFLDQPTAASSSGTIISPLGPSQLLARAREQDLNARLARQRNGTSLDLLLQPSSNGMNDLSTQFAQLSHRNSRRRVTTTEQQFPNLIGDSHLLNGQNQIPDEPPLPQPDSKNPHNNPGILERYCLFRGWPAPVYKVKHRFCPDKRRIVYIVNVEVHGDGVNTFRVGSFPLEHESEIEMKGVAALKALQKIQAEESKVKGDKAISSDPQIICSRISDIVAVTLTGKFARSVEDEYMAKHNERLPQDWLQMVSSWPTLSVESTVNSTIIVPREPPVEQAQFFDPTIAPPSLPIEALGNDEGVEYVYVTHATSVSNVWFRVIGNDYSDEYDILLKDMDEYYNGAGAQDLAVVYEENHYYAAFRFDTWFRVCVIEVDNDKKTVLAWLVDHGDNEVFPFGSLYRLAPQFYKLPRQAVQCVLEGLESFNDVEIANDVISTSESLIGQTLIAKITHKDVDLGFVRALLYDTSGDDDVLVNEKIKDEISAKATPTLPTEGNIMEVEIGDISKKGEVYIMFPGPSLERIIDVLNNLEPSTINEQKLTSFKHISLTKLYLAKYSKDGTWYRAVVTATPSVQHNKIPVRFVDYGNTESVGISDIADLENLPPILRKLPPQAVKVALHKLPPETLSNPEIARLHSLLLDEEKVVLVKTVSLKADPPIVEIFTKEPLTEGKENAALVSINAKIQTQRTLYRNEERNNALLLAPVVAFNGQDDFDLECPVFTVSDFIPILIVLAAHPGHFIFQAKQFGSKLETLRKQMVAYYEAGAMPEVPRERVVKYKLFAARYCDNMWYRVIVADSPIGSRVPVRLCDYGDVTFVNIRSLRELAPEFHVYPFMAVMGKLGGVVPVHKDWTVEDCMRFQDLVVEKILAGIVQNVQENNENPIEMVVTLNLVDTSSEKDIDIADVLVRENRALKTD